MEDACPICQGQMVPLTFRKVEKSRLFCCGKFVCPDCAKKLQDKISIAERASSLSAEASSLSADTLQQSLAEIEKSLSCPLCKTETPSTAEETFKLVLTHAEAGRDWAQIYVAQSYADGTGGVEKDSVLALKWYSMASDQGNSDAVFAIGVAHHNHDSKSLEKAKEWYEKASNLGNVEANYALGQILSNGIGGVKRDTKEAFRLFMIGAEKGHDLSQCALGSCYDQGEGAPRNLEEALKWFTKAAEQGNATAMHNTAISLLSMAHESHGGIEVIGKSPVPRAMQWAQRAADCGDLDSKELVSQLLGAVGNVCGSCRKREGIGNKLNKCTRCKVILYCGRDCQKKHWKAGHKADCCAI